MKKAKIGKILVFILMLALLLSASVFQYDRAVSAGGAKFPYTIYMNDIPGTMFQASMDQAFPGAELSLLDRLIPITQEDADFIQLMPENEAYPILEDEKSTVPRAFYVTHLASLVLATDTERSDVELSSWKEIEKLLESDERIGIFVQPEQFVNTIEMVALIPEERAEIYNNLARLNEEGRLLIYNGAERNTAWPMALIEGELHAEDLPEILIAWDYQIAQANYRMAADRYQMHLAQEGTLSLEMGLMAQGEGPNYILEPSFFPKLSERVASAMLRYGYRISDGRSIANPVAFNENKPVEAKTQGFDLGYASNEEYIQRSLRIEDHKVYNMQLMRSQSIFRKQVLGLPFFQSGSEEEKQLIVLLIIPFLLIWIASIYYRLDDSAIKRPMAILLFWLGVLVIFHFMQVMYSNSIGVLVISYMRFLPIFGMVESWYYTGLSLAESREQISTNLRKKSWLLTIFLYLEAILVLSNEFHDLVFSMSYYLVINRLGIFFYLIVISLFLTTLSGILLILKAQYRQTIRSALVPVFVLIFGTLVNVYFFSNRITLSRSPLDFINLIIPVLFLESCLQSHLIPVNTGYFKLFRSAPVKLRLLTEDLQTIYPEEQYPLSFKDLKRIRTAIEDANERERHGEVVEAGSIQVKNSKKSNIVYNIGQISGGYLIWENDISDLQQLTGELSAITKRLEHQAGILKKEQEIRSQHLSMNIRRKMLQNIENSLSAKMEEMRSSFEVIRNRHGDRDFVKQELSRVKLMVSQCKRKSNLLVRSEEMITMEEMKLILNEVLADAKSAGISGFAFSQGEEAVAVTYVLVFYDYLQYLLQKSVDDGASQYFITFSSQGGRAMMTILYHSKENNEKAYFLPENELQDRMEELEVHLEVLPDGAECTIQMSLMTGEDND